MLKKWCCQCFLHVLLLSRNHEEAIHQLRLLGCDPHGVGIMALKAVFKTVKIEGVSTKAANLLKQTFLAKGGETAVNRGTADLSVDHTDVLICATMKQYRLALTQLKAQPWGLPDLATRIEEALDRESSFPHRQYNWIDRSLDIRAGRTLIMGILNVTPDSFSDGGQYNRVDAAIQRACEMVSQGADIIDVGAESNRPYGSKPICEVEEMERLLPVLEKLVSSIAVPVSVDTYKASVAKLALATGAHLINDIWGLQQTAEMADILASKDAPVIIMHNRIHSTYERDIMSEILSFLDTSIEIGLKAGIPFHHFIIDPGIGFGKTPTQNLEVMSRLAELKSLGCPVLLGSSRKRFIGEALGGVPPDERVEGMGATIAWGIMHGAQIVRVHDVKEMARIAKMTDVMMRRSFHE